MHTQWYLIFTYLLNLLFLSVCAPFLLQALRVCYWNDLISMSLGRVQVLIILISFTFFLISSFIYALKYDFTMSFTILLNQLPILFPLSIRDCRPDPSPCPTKASLSCCTSHSHTAAFHLGNHQAIQTKPHFSVALNNILNVPHCFIITSTLEISQISSISVMIPLFSALCIAIVFTAIRCHQGTTPPARPTSRIRIRLLSSTASSKMSIGGFSSVSTFSVLRCIATKLFI